MKFILGTVGSPEITYDKMAASLDIVYEKYGKDTIIDTGTGYCFKDEENNAEVYIGKWIKERGLKPEVDIKVIDKIPVMYEKNNLGESRLVSFEEILDRKIHSRLGFIPETVLIHALKDSPEYPDDAYLSLAQFIEDTKEIKTSGFSAHMIFNDLIQWITKLEQFSKQHYAMLPYSVLSDAARITENEDGTKTLNQEKNLYGIDVWQNYTIEGFKIAKSHNFKTIIMMPHEQGKIKQVSHSPLWLNWCFRYATMNEYADYIAESSYTPVHLKEDMAIAEGEWYHQNNKDGLQDKIVAGGEELGNW